MVLLVGDHQYDTAPSSLQEVYNKFPHLLEFANNLAAKKPIRLEPEGVLYVRQKQFCVTFPDDRLDNGQEVTMCGTDDVLTCHVIILREPVTGVTAIAHYDSFARRTGFTSLVKAFQDKVRSRREEAWAEDDWEYWDEEVDGPEDQCDNEDEDDDDCIYELHLVGGYADDAGMAHKITQRFFKHLHEVPVKLNLRTCCLGPPNTKKMGGQSQPIIGGVAIDVQSGKISPAVFNRTFTDFPDSIRDTLIIFPPLVIPGRKKQSCLKQMIKMQEVRGFGAGNVRSAGCSKF